MFTLWIMYHHFVFHIYARSPLNEFQNLCMRHTDQTFVDIVRMKINIFWWNDIEYYAQNLYLPQQTSWSKLDQTRNETDIYPIKDVISLLIITFQEKRKIHHPKHQSHIAEMNETIQHIPSRSFRYYLHYKNYFPLFSFYIKA